MIVILNYDWESYTQFKMLMNSYIGYYNTYIYLFEKFDLRLLSMDEAGNIICSECNLKCSCDCDLLKPTSIYAESEGYHLVYLRTNSPEVKTGDYIYPLTIYDWYNIEKLFPFINVLEHINSVEEQPETVSIVVYSTKNNINFIHNKPIFNRHLRDPSPLGEIRRNIRCQYLILRRKCNWASHYCEVIKWSETQAQLINKS